MLRRSKIKKKYLDIIYKSSNLEINNQLNIIDKFELVIMKSLKMIGLILLLIFWGLIPYILVGFAGYNLDTMNTTTKIIIMFISDLSFLVLLISFYKDIFFRDFKNYFEKNLKNNLKTSFSFWIVGFIIMIISNLIIDNLTDGVIAQNEESVREMIKLYPIYMAFQLAIYAPITEELIFRKSFKDITQKKYIYPLLSGLIFGGLHIITSLDQPLGILYLIPYSTLGIAFALLYKKTDNIFSTIVVHSFHNTLLFCIYLWSMI